MDELDIKKFWECHPCGDAQVGGLSDSNLDAYKAFFNRYDEFRYTKEKHILDCLDAIDFEGKRVLEIGLGQGADSEQIIRRGAIWSGLDLTAESVARVRTRLKLRDLRYDAVKQGSALAIPFSDSSFDLVFSHGVLHHIPDIDLAQKEIARVLDPNGALIAMLYAKWSLNYMLAIGVVRRLGLLALYLGRPDMNGMLGQHLANARETGLLRYLRLKNFIHRNTDGPLNPYSKVYSVSEVKRDFPNFEVIDSYKRFMHAPPLPLSRLPLGRVLGWHLWVHLRPIGTV